MPCVSCELPYLPLTCCDGISKYFREVVLVSGIFNNGRTLCEISHQIPPDLSTDESAAAWLVYALRQNLDERSSLPDWVSLGRANQMLVPMIAEKEAYKSRPACHIEADFARILRARITALIAELTSHASLRIEFDGSMLQAVVNKEVVKVPAEGIAWSGQIVVPNANVFEFPKRIAAQGTTLDFWDCSMGLGRQRYHAEWVEDGRHD